MHACMHQLPPPFPLSARTIDIAASLPERRESLLGSLAKKWRQVRST